MIFVTYLKFWAQSYFVDDTTVFYCHNHLSDVVNEELKVVWDWFEANTLSLNEKKNHKLYVLGTAKQIWNIIDKNSVNISLDGCKLNRVRDTKFLAITIDENQTWEKNESKLYVNLPEIQLY